MFLISKQLDPVYTYCANVLSETNRWCRFERRFILWVSSEDSFCVDLIPPHVHIRRDASPEQELRHHSVVSRAI
jgi:hypothetical protein